MFHSVFSGRVWVDKLHFFHKKICFSNNCCHGNRKYAISFLAIAATAATREKKLYQKLESYRYKLLLKKLTGPVQGEIKYYNLKNVLEKACES